MGENLDKTGSQTREVDFNIPDMMRIQNYQDYQKLFL